MSVLAGLDSKAEGIIAPRQVGPDAAPVRMRLVSGDDWDRIVSGFDAVCQEQLHAFAVLRWPNVRHEPVVFERDGRIVGGTLMMLQPLPLRTGVIAVSKWAPMLADVHAADAAVIHAQMVDLLVADYAERRGMMLSILPWASIDPVNQEYVALRARGFHRGSTLLFPNRYIVRLRLSDQDQRSSFQQTWRRQLNKSEKSGLVFEHAPSERIDDFKALYAAMTERKQFPDHSAFETLDGLMALEEPLRPEQFYVYHEGELVAGAVIFKAGDRAVYLYGATSDSALPLRAGYFMHWHIIRWLRDHTRANWYDLGGTDGFLGLHQFKKGMVGDAGVIRPVPPVVNYASNPVAYWSGMAAFGARDLVQHVRRRLDAMSGSKSKPDQPPHETEEYLK
ncbi:MAG: GNAT family N-acetyltransferase [Devosia sp.]|uniref:lipid II:glycine glycyltransferase FemX n=1 Tax=Devosia sp. TaxID=1871048 RepID=UPI0024C59BEE|nr:GNAT family N-acetyltransferase [Devosia sp.]UYO00717.1 MAG: GNAT family N-acetyltransferase [Devosia sp.]